MSPETFNRIRADKGLSIADMARLLRIRDRSTIHRWATGHTPVSGPASIILELIEYDALPYRYYEAAGVKVPETKVQSVGYASRWQKYGSDENKRVSEMVETLFALPYVALADSDGDDGA